MESFLTPELLTVSANHAGLVARELGRRGFDVEAIFSEVGLELPKSNSPAKRITAGELIKLLKLAIEKSGDPAIPLKLYQEVQLADLDALGFAISCSSTYLSLLRRFQRFSKYILSNGAIQIIEESDGYLFLADIEDDEALPSEERKDGVGLYNFSKKFVDMMLLMEAFGMGLIKLSNDICQEKLSPEKVYVHMISHPVVRDEIQKILPNSMICSAPFVGIKLRKEFAEKKLPLANPEMARLNDEIIVKHLEQIFQNDVVFRVEALIREGLSIGEFSRSDVAIKLGMSERRLQQRLDERKTSFSDILLRVRKTLAVQYIREDKLRINQIAYALGFTNGSNFARSFKFWTGYTPNEFKEL